MRTYKKPYRVKKKRPISKNRFFRLGILVLTLLFSIFYLLFFSDAFLVERIIVIGEGIDGELEKQLFSLKGKNIFLINLVQIRNDILNDFPGMAQVEISRGFPDVLSISVRERSAVAVWCEGEKCFLVDNEGVVFEELMHKPEGLVRISGARETLERTKISQILEIQAKLGEGLGITTTQAFIYSDERTNIKTSEGWEIYFNLKGDLDWQIQELGLVLEKQIPFGRRSELEYIDLRFSRVYYKFLSEDMR